MNYRNDSSLSLRNVLPFLTILALPLMASAATGPLGYWTFDEGTGTTVVDSSGNNNTATLINGPTWVTGKTGLYALNFSSGCSCYGNIPNSSTVNATGDFTVALWVKSTQGMAANQYPMIVNKDPGNGTGIQIGLHDSTADARWYGGFEVGGRYTSLYGTSNIADGAWHHIVLVRQGSTLFTYEDGTLANTQTGVSTATLTNTVPLRFGRSNWASPYEYYYSGAIDDVRFYQRALSASEIAGLAGVNTNTTDTTPPSIPTGISGTAISQTQINLTWIASTDPSTGSGQASGVTGYKVFRNGTQIGTSATNAYSDTGLTASTVYSYTVSAYDAAGNNSALSSSISVTTISSSSSSSSSVVAPAFFGFNTMSALYNPWPTVPVSTLRTWDQYPPVTWAAINPAQGVYDWTALDQIVNTAVSHGVDILYTFGAVPQWASTNPNGTGCGYLYQIGNANGSCYAPDTTAWSNFVTAITNRYKGKIKYWELWNEPNISIFWRGTTAQMVTMAQTGHPIIKNADPGNIVVSPSPSGTGGYQWLDSYFSAGGASYTDTIAFHSYLYGAPELITTLVINIKNVQAKYSTLNGKPLWDTENSWGPSTWSFGTNADQQSAWLARFITLSISSGIQRSMWYMWDGFAGQTNYEWGQMFDLYTNQILKTGIAYGQIYNWLVGAVDPCVLNGSVYSCHITRAGGYEGLIVWASSSNPSFTTSYTVPSQYVQYKTLDVTRVATSGGSILTLTMKPILLEKTTGSDIVAPSAPTNLSGTASVAAQTVSTVNLFWSASTDNVGVTGYKIFRNGTLVGFPATSSYIDTNLAKNTSYTYTVSAYDAASNNSAKSSSISVKTTSLDPSNFVADPGFESNTIAPWTVYGAAASTDNPHSGTYAVVYGAGGGLWQTIYGLAPNTTYTLSAWGEVISPGTTYIGAKLYNGSTSNISTSFTSTSYTKGSLTFTTGPSNTSAQIYGWADAGSLSVDDFALTASSPTTNLSTNPGFESGAAPPWVMYGSASISTTNPHAGVYAAKLSANSGVIETITGLTPNTTYTLTGWGKLASAGTAWIGARYYNGSTSNKAVAVSGTTYAQASVIFKTGPSTTSADIYGWAGTGSLFVDDFSLTK